ncbi:MAG: fused protease/ribonucleoside-triphosphate reductase [Phycisphaerales bacterium JB052]
MSLFKQLHKFTLIDSTREWIKGREVKWGFGALSEFTFARTYSRDGERWADTCIRVVEGTFTILKTHCHLNRLPWDEDEAQKKASFMLGTMFDFKWLPPGRGLWMMGTDYVFERSGAPLNNCGFRSTRNIDQHFSAPFTWTFDMLMLGVGVGFDTRGADLPQPVHLKAPETGRDVHVVEDSREGWVRVLERFLDAWVGKDTLPAQWDYSQVRPEGTPIKTFGGIASGPAPLVKMLDRLTELFAEYTLKDKPVDSTFIVDTMNIVGACVVCGGVRRTAQIAIGEPDDEAFLDLKLDMEKLGAWRWASNNSPAILDEHEPFDFGPIAKRISRNGEPGVFFLDRARKFGRLADPPNFADMRALGANPCLEQTLEDGELCCLAENFPAHCDDYDEFKAVLKMSYLYAKAVTLVPTHNQLTNTIMLRNRRIGNSISGVVQAVARHGYQTFLQWCDDGYQVIQDLDVSYSEWLCVRKSIKTTSVKPSGTVSILAGATPGVHFDHAQHYIRRVRIDANSPLVQVARDAGYDVEPDAVTDRTMVISFPVKTAFATRSKHEVTIWEKASLAAALQTWWADNQVSCTVEFSPDEKDDIERVLDHFALRLKGISFLPMVDHGYAQPPYETINAETYRRMIAKTKPLVIPYGQDNNEVVERFCDGDSCEI